MNAFARMPSTTSEEEISLNKEFFPALMLLDSLPDLCFLVSNDGVILEANNVVCATLKRPKEQLLGSLLASHIISSERLFVEETLNKCFLTGSNQQCTSQFHSSDRTSVNVQMFFSPVLLPHKREYRLCVVNARDVTEQKKHELDFLRFFNVVEQTVNPIQITDVKGNMIYVNPSFEKASGYSKEELLGKNPSIFKSGKHSNGFWKNVWNTINSGKVWVGEIENTRKNGEPFFAHVLISPIIDESKTLVGFLGVHRDITEQKYLEQHLIHVQKMESIGTLSAGVAHEVGNPLTSISSIVQIIQRTTKEGFTKEKLELVKSQINRISRILRDLVDFSRRSTYELQLTDINKCIRESVEIVRVGKKAKGISFNSSLDDTVPLLRIVPDQILQVFINILINAADALITKAEQQHCSVESMKAEISATTQAHGKYVSISICDNGTGISQEHLEKIFEPFFTTKKIGEGTGLGLWVSYGIIKSFQGDIQVHSEEGKGTTFTVILPINLEI
ncbi:MAG: PAS domain S-box protein [Ignavibacteria bacterium]|nr:PAS domain S-box protein [Ignavibacteria bacterium]